MATDATNRYHATTQAIVSQAVKWVATQLWKRQDLVHMPMKDWPVDNSLFLGTEATHKAMDIAALSGDEAATRTAARAYCEAWQRIFRTATQEEE